MLFCLVTAVLPVAAGSQPVAALAAAQSSSVPAPLFPELEAGRYDFSRLAEGYPGGPRNDVRAVHLDAEAAADPATIEHLLDLAASSNLNALVIDVKDDTGVTTYPSAVPDVVAVGASSQRIADLGALLRLLDEHGIYTIGRLVVFADPVLATARPDLAIQTPSGAVWRDQTGHGWTNPYSEQVWEYNLAIACEVASLGCREIQFDYVRFPSDGKMDLIRYPTKTDLRPAGVIEAFLSRARAELAPYGAFIGADVFGLVTSFAGDMLIGQVLENVARQVDFVCPMLYPSHYERGNYGLPDPEADPYQTVRIGLTDALRRLKGWEGVMVRPWLQDFSWRVHYGVPEVRAQIQAAREVGIEGYMLWSMGDTYTEDAIR